MAEEPSAHSSRSRGILQHLGAIAREPLTHFAIAAVLLLGAQHFFARPEIVVSPQLLSGLCQEFEAKAQRAPTPGEVERLAQEYVDEEVFFREALRTGMAQDNRVRAVLIQTMRTSLRPLLPEPTDEELEALRRETPERYRAPGKLSFAHVSYAAASEVPPGLLERLRAGDVVGPGTLTKFPSPLPPTDRKQIAWIFDEPFDAALAGCEEGVWSGPITSRRGVHFVRLLDRTEATEMPLAEIRPKLAAFWSARKESEVLSAKAAEMRQAYRVKLPPLSAPAPAP